MPLSGDRSPLNQLLWQYFYLQVLDFLTTIAFLVNGVREGNPLVRLALSVGTNPVASLLVVKLLAILLGFYCWRVGKRQLLSRINLLFAASRRLESDSPDPKQRPLLTRRAYLPLTESATSPYCCRCR